MTDQSACSQKEGEAMRSVPRVAGLAGARAAYSGVGGGLASRWSKAGPRALPCSTLSDSFQRYCSPYHRRFGSTPVRTDRMKCPLERQPPSDIGKRQRRYLMRASTRLWQLDWTLVCLQTDIRLRAGKDWGTTLHMRRSCCSLDPHRARIGPIVLGNSPPCIRTARYRRCNPRCECRSHFL